MTGANMSFLAASRLIKSGQDLPSKNINVNSSCNLHQLNLYIKAYGAKYGFNVNIDELVFGTLRQSLYQEDNSVVGVLILFPWDFLGSLDWRTGIQTRPIDLDSALKEIDEFYDLVSSRHVEKLFYLEADLPPVCSLSSDLHKLQNYISFLAGKLNCEMLEPGNFCLKAYLSNGCPFSSNSLSSAGQKIADAIFSPVSTAKKVIVTDLDFTFWHGILGEDGPNGIKFLPDGSGFIHFIYQTFLRRLKECGVLLCISSKNDADLVAEAFAQNQFGVEYDDFVSIRASYQAKSTEIARMASELNLGLADFVFIDDNPVEIEEVKQALPAVACVQFPTETRHFAGAIRQIYDLFQIENVTAEDKNRTSLYKRMKRSNAESSRKETNIDEFLISLDMRIELFERTAADNDRAVQLINKTNQFNANGERISKEKCDAMLENGYRLITAKLEDKNGDHGEIIVILLDENNSVVSFVMSCRVFQRQLEFVFLLAVLRSFGIAFLSIPYIKTDRNEPFRLFISKLSGSASTEHCEVTPDLILNRVPHVEKLFTVKVGGYDGDN